eukprot:TRINITY_DN2537_c0_g1_i1.p2 TRINITY_DN2537_c0_g1~~TRINITY_DN2537_c0_g1_i1.p2  ORF type:complete len:110 (-),score=14.20 TRINITY_DN2537_c0_g1_i1:502-831(-)
MEEFGASTSHDIIFQDVKQQVSLRYKAEQLQKVIQELSEARKGLVSTLSKLSQKGGSYVWHTGPGGSFSKISQQKALDYLTKQQKQIEEELAEMRRDECELLEQLESEK